MRCDEVRDLAAELALGIADGEARGDALAHLSGCAACRRAMQEMAGVADALLTLAPAHDPEPGFEVRVLERIGLRARQRRRRISRPAVGIASGALAAAAVASAVLLFGFQSDRNLASYYRSMLARTHGHSFQAAPLFTPRGQRAGELFAYEGSPSWIFVTISGRYQTTYRCELITRRGRVVAMPGTWGQANWGAAIPIRAGDVAAVRLFAIGHAPKLEGTLPKPPVAS